MLQFDIRHTGVALQQKLTELQRKHLPRAQLAAVDRAGRYVHGALRSEMQEVFDRPTPWALGGLRFKKPTMGKPVVSIWLEEFGGKGIPAAVFLRPQIEGGKRRHKRFERALIQKGLMSPLAYAVPGGQAPLDAYGNVPGSFIVRMMSDLQAFGEEGYRANRKGKRRGNRKSNYFFVGGRPGRGAHLKPGIYWKMPGGLLGVVFAFVSSTSYRPRLDFYGVGERAYNRVAARFMSEELAKLVRRDNR